jgi:LytR cell envelope-related transcriptional attenuator
VASTLTRRPLPALVSLVALLLLTSLVWWRVLHRGGDASAGSTPCPTPTMTVSETLPAQAQVTVQVLNATNRAGIAAKARTALTDDGFKSPKPATNDRPRVRVRGVAEIRYGPSALKAAKLLAYYFPGATLVPTTSKYTTVVVSLGDQYKRVATPEAVTAALTKDHVALQSTGPTPSGSPSC